MSISAENSSIVIPRLYRSFSSKSIASLGVMVLLSAPRSGSRWGPYLHHTRFPGVNYFPMALLLVGCLIGCAVSIAGRAGGPRRAMLEPEFIAARWELHSAMPLVRPSTKVLLFAQHFVIKRDHDTLLILRTGAWANAKPGTTTSRQLVHRPGLEPGTPDL